MRILVYGAGVLGSVYAAHLHNGGHNVAVLARGKRLEDIREHGIVLEELHSGCRQEFAVPVVERLEPTDSYDLVLVIVRKSQVASVLPALAANTYTPNVAFLMNNAAGPDQLVKALGPKRVLMGFPGAGGVFRGHVVHYAVRGRGSHRLETTLGELDGRTTPRLQTIVEAFSDADIPVAISSKIDAWLRTHVALVSPVAQALYRTGGDNYALARDRDTIGLMLRAVREGLRVVQAVGFRITPWHLNLITWLPPWLLVPLLKKLLNTEFAEIALAGHANAARDELKALAEEFDALIAQTSIPTPAIEELRSPVTSPYTAGVPHGVSGRKAWRLETKRGIAAASSECWLSIADAELSWLRLTVAGDQAKGSLSPTRTISMQGTVVGIWWNGHHL